jgi:hypothetical protein
MVQRRKHLGFALETRETLRVLRDSGRKNLDRYVAIQLRVPGAVHLSHATRAEGRKDLVGTELRTGRQRQMVLLEANFSRTATL